MRIKINKLLVPHTVILLCALIFSVHSFSQRKNNSFQESLNTLLIKQPTEYNTIESSFRKFKGDSTKMRRLASECFALHYSEGESYALNALGIIYRNISLYPQAIEYHKKAEALAIEINNSSLRAISLNMLGVVHRRMDMVRSALDYHTQAFVIAKAVENPSEDIQRSIAVSLNSMGNIYLALEQYDMALAKFQSSLAIETETNNKLGLAINYHNIGYSKEGKGNLEAALIDYNKSLSYNEMINSDVGRAICFNSIGQVYLKQGKHDDALKMVRDAYEKAKGVGDQFYIATSLSTLGSVEKEMADYKNAKNHLEEAVSIAEKFSLKSVEAESRMHLSDLNKILGNSEMALFNFQKATEIEKSITNQRNLNYINDLILKYDNDTKIDQIKELAIENEKVKSRLQNIQLSALIGIVVLLLSALIFVGMSRNRKLNHEKKILRLEQDMLRSQMNPHFIFNSLNSIKLYIINNEKENAVYYLNKFAKLIRKILVVSKEKSISLAEELQTMELYMNIENIRFNNEIDFDIDIDDSVNIETVRVPSLILQPFLENALWHGLSSKIGSKKIGLKVNKNEDHVKISINDNGIGRLASASIKKKKTLQRKSVGIELTKERLENFSKGYEGIYHINIEDLYDENKQSVGTQVVIAIPIRQNILESA
jgi:tetratricopeptide (TPR) repeat protein